MSTRRAVLFLGDEAGVVQVEGVDRAAVEDLRVAKGTGDEFGHALIAACVADPPLTVDDVSRIQSDWPAGDYDALLQAAYSCSDTEPRDFSERLDADDRLEEELDYCVPLGIEHCRFLGWCPSCQDKALTWKRRQRAACPGCGLRKDQWQDDPAAFTPYHEVCDMCATVETYRERSIPKDMKGVRVFVLPTSEWLRLTEDAESVNGAAG